MSDGRVPSEPGSREPSPDGLGPPGFDPSRIAALTGDRYSPNLRKFMARQAKLRAPLQRVFRDSAGTPYIGFIDGDWFLGGKLWRVLCVGTRAETWAYQNLANELTEIADFWPRYERIGRCAIDEDHSHWWINGQSRWEEIGDIRTCQWCGLEQVRHRWEETVKRECWSPCDSDRSPEGRDRNGLDGEAATARAEGIAKP